MALISSESMILMVNGTLQSEFFTMFWPTRLTYSTTTGSVMRWADFSISMEYCLPVLISQLVEYQLVTPRPPMLRVPMESTSSSLPFLMCGSSASPGEGRTSDLAVSAVFAAGGLDAVSDAESGLAAPVSVFALLSLGTPNAGRSELLADGWVGTAAGWVDAADGWVDVVGVAGCGAGCIAAAGCVAAGAVAAGAVVVESEGVVADGVVAGAVEEGAGCCALPPLTVASRAAASRAERPK